MQVSCGDKNEVSPSLTNLRQFVPPAFAVPIPQMDNAIFVFLEDSGSTERKYVEKRVIIQDVGSFTRPSNDRRSDLYISCCTYYSGKERTSRLSYVESHFQVYFGQAFQHTGDI
jgi:hypothetical protein